MLTTTEHPKHANMHKISQFSNSANVFLRVLKKICWLGFIDILFILSRTNCLHSN